MGGGGQYPWPDWVWSPAGGWWSLPTNWRRNAMILGAVGAGVSILLWSWTGQREIRHNPPTRRIPSMLWSPNAREAYKQGQESGVTARRLGIDNKSSPSQHE